MTLEVFLVFLRLGLTSFGGPIAHLGYMHGELVLRRKWVDEETYADLVALCQFLPGPASSQVAMSLGIERAGLAGGVAAWLGFTLPSAVILTLFALGMEALGPASGWIHGLKVVAVPVVALAIRDMAKNLCPDRARGTIAIAAAVLALAFPVAQILILLGAALAGWIVFGRADVKTGLPLAAPVSRRAAVVAWAIFTTLIVGLPIACTLLPSGSLLVFARFFRVGSLVFGGGHVVLPLLEAEVVAPGWTTSERFLAGYGAAQAVPGPLFSFSAYLGATISAGPGGWPGAALALVAIFLPSYLFVVGAIPFREKLRASRACQAALRGTNAAVVGLLVAAFYDPVFTKTILTVRDFELALGAFALLAIWKAPPWLVVILAAGVGRVISP